MQHYAIHGRGRVGETSHPTNPGGRQEGSPEISGGGGGYGGSRLFSGLDII